MARRNKEEQNFQNTVMILAATLGWIYYHTYDSRMNTPGFPDLMIVRAPRVIVAELKSRKGRPSPAQEIWLDEFKRCPGVETYLWRPDDIDEIAKVLNEGPQGEQE